MHRVCVFHFRLPSLAHTCSRLTHQVLSFSVFSGLFFSHLLLHNTHAQFISPSIFSLSLCPGTAHLHTFTAHCKWIRFHLHRPSTEGKTGGEGGGGTEKKGRGLWEISRGRRDGKNMKGKIRKGGERGNKGVEKECPTYEVEGPGGWNDQSCSYLNQPEDTIPEGLFVCGHLADLDSYLFQQKNVGPLLRTCFIRSSHDKSVNCAITPGVQFKNRAAARHSSMDRCQHWTWKGQKRKVKKSHGESWRRSWHERLTGVKIRRRIRIVILPFLGLCRTSRHQLKSGKFRYRHNYCAWSHQAKGSPRLFDLQPCAKGSRWSWYAHKRWGGLGLEGLQSVPPPPPLPLLGLPPGG